jgi:hypothetical protein
VFILTWVLVTFLGEAGVIAPQVGIEKIIKYFIDIVVPKYIIPLFIA